jgi:hypothetical protein
VILPPPESVRIQREGGVGSTVPRGWPSSRISRRLAPIPDQPDDPMGAAQGGTHPVLLRAARAAATPAPQPQQPRCAPAASHVQAPLIERCCSGRHGILPPSPVTAAPPVRGIRQRCAICDLGTARSSGATIGGAGGRCCSGRRGTSELRCCPGRHGLCRCCSGRHGAVSAHASADAYAHCRRHQSPRLIFLRVWFMPARRLNRL